jgi:hypothetical protein
MRTYGEPIDVRTATGSATATALSPEGPDVDEAPVQFLWRGRLYVVRAVLAHWIELGSWWTGATRPARPARPKAARPARSAQPGPDRSGVDAWRGARASAARLAAGIPEPEGDAGHAGHDGHEHEPVRRSVALDVGAVERAVWRVEARAGRSSLVGVYDLVHDIPAASSSSSGSSDRWRLARALD